MVPWFEIYTWFTAVENAQPKFVFGSISLVYVLVLFSNLHFCLTGTYDCVLDLID